MLGNKANTCWEIERGSFIYNTTLKQTRKCRGGRLETATAVALNGSVRGFLKATAMTDVFRLRSPGVIFSKVGLKLVSKSQLYSSESTLSAFR